MRPSHPREDPPTGIMHVKRWWAAGSWKAAQAAPKRLAPLRFATTLAHRDLNADPAALQPRHVAAPTP
jgi:hypothetical protein